ncbi:uncharacterized protein LOC115811955 isoform X2 [Chanos chanos]|uniref:Uncharacterized protein LOC115811955 isoform X2 n=1 Tax=Chanos chanos TaxID=29144 RepID=A0A6J2VBN8_CHACN|nr:uncharacterized protein LOC115811955 isoform X2 [Chanos chanos]
MPSMKPPHSVTHSLKPLILIRVMGGAGAYPSGHQVKVGETPWTGHQGRLTYSGRKPELLEEAHTNTGRACKFHTERTLTTQPGIEPGPSCCGTHCTTAPPRSQQSSPKKQYVILILYDEIFPMNSAKLQPRELSFPGFQLLKDSTFISSQRSWAFSVIISK